MENSRSFGECRCCLAKGDHRSLVKEYCIDGKRVVFKEHLLECFNYFLSTNPDITTLICDTCIRSLRAARSFRSQVLRIERQLLKARGIHNETEFVLLQSNLCIEDEPAFIKEESCHSLDTHFETCELGVDGLVPGEKDLLERFPPKTLQPLPTKESLFRICPIFYGHLESLKGKIVKASAVQTLSEAGCIQNSARDHVAISEKLAQAINAATLLENSNATVFKSKMRSGFPCFYCRDIFLNPKTLRDHQAKHPKALLYKLLTKYTADALVVYADITDLKCSLCSESVNNLDLLKRHLSDAHNKKLYENYADRVIPFRLENRESNYECQICARSFETFGATDRHMNEHFSNYVCEECGAGFVTKHRLKVHTYLLHSKHIGVIKCDLCNKIFASKFKYKIHNEYVHKKLKKMQCNRCPEKFIDYFSRQRHLEEKHGADVLSYKCKECDRAFNRKYSLTCHVNRVHLAQKDVQCDLCPFMCFNKSELRDHMHRHSGDRNFQCTLCQKTFSRKKTLTVHMKVHSDDRNQFSETFAQKKIDVKTHDSVYVDL